VDDEAAILSTTQQTLEAFGYKVMVAQDGAEAIALYAQHRGTIAVVITDMVMPIMDGIATINALMRINPQVIVIAASGLYSNGRVAKAAGVGVKHFLPKPYTAETLLITLREVLRS
jgi:CheY-like chemotaxis protein